MNITLDNYEAYFLDYNEGLLNSEQLGELSLFLALNPALKAQLETIKKLTLTPDIIGFNNKLSLKKFEFQTTPITDYNFTDFCIAYHEGILNEEKTSEIKSFCSDNPKRELIFKQFKTVYLKPQLGLTFQGKVNLYKKVSKKRTATLPLIRFASIAAGIALIIFVYTNYILKKEAAMHYPTVAKLSRQLKDDGIVVSSPITNNPEVKQTKKVNNHIKYLPTYKKFNSDAQNKTDPIPKEQVKLALLNPSEHKLIERPDKFALKEYISESEHTSDIQSTNKILTGTAGEILEKLTNEVINLNEIKDNKGKFSLFKIFKAGIRGINYLTDSNMSLTEKTDSTGNVTALSFESEIVKFNQKRNY